MFKRILIAYDGSDHSRRAAKFAGDFARTQSSAELWLVCVVDMIPVGYGEHYIHQLVVENMRAGEELLGQAKKLIGKKITIHDELLFGSPADNIVTVADKNDCDLIIMGARGLGGLRGLLLGSQVHKVIVHSKCPVLSIK